MPEKKLAALPRRVAIQVMLDNGRCPRCREVAWHMPNDCDFCEYMGGLLSNADVGCIGTGEDPDGANDG